jgi:hypothetical protein
MFSRILFFTLLILFSFSCRYVGEKVVTSQSSIETNVNAQTAGEINGSISEPNANNLLPEADTGTFAKTFVVTGRFDDSKKAVVYTDHLIEFKAKKGIGVYVDKKEKSLLKFETNNPKIRADFLESNGERLFVLVVGSAGFGSCGDSIFAVAKVNEKLDVKLSKTNAPDCQGEFYPVKIENADEKENFYRRISVGDLKFNVKSFEWENR